MASKIPQFNIRMPPSLKVQMELEAMRAGRSLNSELVLRLERTLTMADPDENDQDLAKAINWLARMADRAGLEVDVVLRRKGKPALVQEKEAADLSDRVPD